MLALGTVAIGLVILIIMEQGKEKTAPKEKVKLRRVQPVSTLPQPIKKTVTNDIMNEARDKLRLLDLEREILSYAVRRLYEASAEGKISEAERDRLALKYKMDLARINEDIERGESIVALNELERMQEELVKLFSERFDEMNKKIDGLKLRSGLVTSPPNETIILETMKKQPPEKEEPREESAIEEKAEDQKQPADKTVEPKTKKASKPKPPAEPETGEAEKKVEEIVAEVEKVLKKLGQMEVEE
jgi:hypothetical protein